MNRPSSRHPVGEEVLAAAGAGLLAQPRLWPTLDLPPATPALAAQAPWTAYWSARRDPGLAPGAARETYAAALACFDARNETSGGLLALAALMETYYVDEGSLQPLDHWIGELVSRLPADDPAWPSLELQAQVMACGLAILLRDQAHPLLARWAESGPDLLRRLAPGAVRLKLATMLLHYHVWRGEFSKSALIVDTLPGLNVEGLLPGEALAWYEGVASHARFTGQHQRGREAVEAALALMQAHGLQQHGYALHAHGAALALAALDAPRADVHLQAMRPALEQHPQADQTHYWHMQAGLHLLRGDTAQALELARMALGNSHEIGGPYRTAVHQTSLGTIWLAHGNAAAALPPLQAAQEAARRIDATMLEFSIGLLQSAAHAQLGDTAAADAALRTALAQGAAHDYRTTSGWWRPQLVAERLARAIEQGLEPDYARRFARAAALQCPDHTLAGWPWPLRVVALGQWRVERDDAPLDTAGSRTQQRPFDLLRALLAHEGHALPVATALEWLWPDGQADAQRKAFDAALGRLRRLLGDDSLLRLEGGQLLLDRSRVWTDVGALAEIAGRLESAADLAARRRAAETLLALVRGPFLADVEAWWAMPARERYRRRFVMAVARLAEAMEGDDIDAAVRLYEQALAVDPLAESLHRRLMRLHAARGDRSEALRAWRHCQAMLQLAGGMPPGSETRALARQLQLG